LRRLGEGEERLLMLKKMEKLVLLTSWKAWSMMEEVYAS
jgi:hypothetical protein